MKVNSEGKLIFDFERGEVTESAPIAWQAIDGKRVSVTVSYWQLSEMEVGFTLGTYDPAYPLLIDPTWRWHTFIGSWDIDYGYGIGIDDSGNVYVAGHSNATWGTTVYPYARSYDAFAVPLSPNSVPVPQWN